MGGHDNWNELLADDSDDQVAETLRRMAGCQDVQGVTAAVVQLSGSRGDDVRMWAAEALETAVQPSAEEVVSLATILRQAEDGEICYWAATMLGRLGPSAAPAVEALAGCLRKSLYLPAREQAAWALYRIGPHASAAAATLQATAKAAPPRLHRMVTEALRAIGEAA